MCKKKAKWMGVVIIANNTLNKKTDKRLSGHIKLTWGTTSITLAGEGSAPGEGPAPGEWPAPG